jgi:phosphoribosylanthranilate isomerase
MAKDVIASLPPFVIPVGVFVDEDIQVLAKTAKKCALKVIQLHGTETPEYCAQAAALTSLPVIKAVRMQNEESLSLLSQYAGSVSYFLLDTFVEGQEGGTGQAFNWDLAVKAKDAGKPFFLAGGLTPENVAEAVEKVLPFGVDVCSGVERLQRRKDFDKMKLFIRRARGLK